jgi:hypothetical protein
MNMNRDVAEAMRRNSLPDLVLLAGVYSRDQPATGAPGAAGSFALAEVNQALLSVIERIDHAPRDLAAQAGDALQYLVWQPPTPAARLEDLAYLFKMPDSPELAPAVEAAANLLLDQGTAGKDVLFSRALLASEVMRERVAGVLTRRGDTKAAGRLRTPRRRGVMP